VPDHGSQDAAFSGSIPEIYDRCLGPLLFEPYAEDLARRAVPLRPRRVLEIAAGTGVATAAIAKALPTVEIVATDLNQAMLDVAASRVVSRKVKFRAADAQSLPFADGGFDLVMCQYGVMFFPQRVDAYREVRRALKPGGQFLFNVWDGLDGNPIPRIVEAAVATLFPDDPPRFLSRTPYGYGDAACIAADLDAAGFADAEIATVILPSRADTARQAAIGFAHGSPLRMEIEARDASMLDQSAEVATKALEAEYGAGSIAAEMTAFVVLARKPG
jgi:SAM-dependent methyltransferase